MTENEQVIHSICAMARDRGVDADVCESLARRTCGLLADGVSARAATATLLKALSENHQMTDPNAPMMPSILPQGKTMAGHLSISEPGINPGTERAHIDRLTRVQIDKIAGAARDAGMRETTIRALCDSARSKVDAGEAPQAVVLDLVRNLTTQGEQEALASLDI